MGVNEHFSHLPKVGREIQIGKLATGVELLVQTSHGEDAIATFIEDRLVRSVGELLRLKHEEAGDDLEVVLDPVVHLGQRSGASLDPVSKLGLEPRERGQEMSDD